MSAGSPVARYVSPPSGSPSAVDAVLTPVPLPTQAIVLQSSPLEYAITTKTSMGSSNQAYTICQDGEKQTFVMVTSGNSHTKAAADLVSSSSTVAVPLSSPNIFSGGTSNNAGKFSAAPRGTPLAGREGQMDDHQNALDAEYSRQFLDDFLCQSGKSFMSESGGGGGGFGGLTGGDMQSLGQSTRTSMTTIPVPNMGHLSSFNWSMVGDFQKGGDAGAATNAFAVSSQATLPPFHQPPPLPPQQRQSQLTPLQSKGNEYVWCPNSAERDNTDVLNMLYPKQRPLSLEEQVVGSGQPSLKPRDANQPLPSQQQQQQQPPPLSTFRPVVMTVPSFTHSSHPNTVAATASAAAGLVTGANFTAMSGRLGHSSQRSRDTHESSERSTIVLSPVSSQQHSLLIHHQQQQPQQAPPPPPFPTIHQHHHQHQQQQQQHQTIQTQSSMQPQGLQPYITTAASTGLVNHSGVVTAASGAAAAAVAASATSAPVDYERCGMGSNTTSFLQYSQSHFGSGEGSQGQTVLVTVPPNSYQLTSSSSAGSQAAAALYQQAQSTSNVYAAVPPLPSSQPGQQPQLVSHIDPNTTYVVYGGAQGSAPASIHPQAIYVNTMPPSSHRPPTQQQQQQQKVPPPPAYMSANESNKTGSGYTSQQQQQPRPQYRRAPTGTAGAPHVIQGCGAGMDMVDSCASYSTNSASSPSMTHSFSQQQQQQSATTTVLLSTSGDSIRGMTVPVSNGASCSGMSANMSASAVKPQLIMMGAASNTSIPRKWTNVHGAMVDVLRYVPYVDNGVAAPTTCISVVTRSALVQSGIYHDRNGAAVTAGSVASGDASPSPALQQQPQRQPGSLNNVIYARLQRVEDGSGHRIMPTSSYPTLVLPVFIQMFPCELRDRMGVLNRVIAATCGLDMGTVVGIEPRSETSFIALIRTSNVFNLIQALRCRILMDRHGFWYAEDMQAYLHLKEYCEDVRRLPQQTRHFQTDGLPCMPLVVELSRAVDRQAIVAPVAPPCFDELVPLASVDRHRARLAQYNSNNNINNISSNLTEGHSLGEGSVDRSLGQLSQSSQQLQMQVSNTSPHSQSSQQVPPPPPQPALSALPTPQQSPPHQTPPPPVPFQEAAPPLCEGVGSEQGCTEEFSNSGLPTLDVAVATAAMKNATSPPTLSCSTSIASSNNDAA